MRAWMLKKVSDLRDVKLPLELLEVSVPSFTANDILIKVSCCGVCHTELDEIEGRTPPPEYPMIPGHQVIGYIQDRGNNAKKYEIGERVGIAWIFSACGKCEFCLRGLENLCPDFRATGRDLPGGYAEYIVIDENFVYPIPSVFSDVEAAPLLCAGAIGYRSLKLTGLQPNGVLALTGFGASGHLVLKMAKYLYPDAKIIAFARSREEQEFAKTLGAVWAGAVTDNPPFKANAVIDTTPVWHTIVESLRHLKPGGRLVVNAIRKEDEDKNALLRVNYQDHLWQEKEIKSVANITRNDVEEFLSLAAKIPIKPEVEIYPFTNANEALLDLRQKHVRGAKVLVVNT